MCENVAHLDVVNAHVDGRVVGGGTEFQHHIACVFHRREVDVFPAPAFLALERAIVDGAQQLVVVSGLAAEDIEPHLLAGLGIVIEDESGIGGTIESDAPGIEITAVTGLIGGEEGTSAVAILCIEVGHYP